MKKQFLYIIILVLSSAPILAMDMNQRSNYNKQSNNSEEGFDNINIIFSGGVPQEQNQIKNTQDNNIDGFKHKSNLN